ncbi:hypothetical protein Y032_0014g2202 [Ancylostoma ceylanicum]|uniref:Uncharacterized protein n=1 Tax=Ancylostoma ceylanicum TaxID=53326 RepID=A0A016V8A7_9BILA|nr:hypothetical protein Y032_0014g2202 [Ancylostoma ceylanicum]
MSEEPSDRALLEQMERELLGESPSPDKPSTEGLTEDTRRKRTRGRRSRNRRQRRRHESSDSSRSIYSPSSRSSENSDEDMGMEDDEEEDDNAYLERRAKEAREAPLRAVHEPTSPLEEPSLSGSSSRVQSARRLR